MSTANNFVLPIDVYKRDFTIIETYVRRMGEVLHRVLKIEKAEAETFMRLVVNGVNLAERTIHFTIRGKNGDRTVTSTDILNYLKKVQEKNLVMSPTMTTYLPVEEKESLIVADVSEDMAERKKVKYEAHLAKLADNQVLAVIKGGRQICIKTDINSWSGASLDKHNPFRCPSLHPTLTLMCRISTALATATVEKFISGKRYYHTPEKIMEDIMAIIDRIDRMEILRTMEEFNLYQPTVRDAMTVIMESASYYIFDDTALIPVWRLLETLSPAELAAFCYDGDFYHLFEYNYDTIHALLTQFAETENLEIPEQEHFNRLGGDEAALVSNLIGRLIQGTPLGDFLDEEKHPKDNPIRSKANQVIYNIVNQLDKYSNLIKCFFRVKHFPLNVAAQNHAIRKAVTLGDTDSTVYSTKSINRLYFGEAKFDESQEPIADVIVYFANGIIAHVLAQFTAQLGVPVERRHLLVMKNEFKFPSLVLVGVAKHYYAYVKAQEGLVFSKPKFEIKGMRNHAGNVNPELVEELQTWMKTNMVNLNKGKLINRGELIDIMLRVEGDIIASFSRKDNLYFKRESVKPKSECKLPDSGSYNHYTLWNCVFGDKYGKAPNVDKSSYRAYKVNLDFSLGEDYVLSQFDKKQQWGFQEWRRIHNKKDGQLPTSFLVPIDNFNKFGLPKELYSIVNVKKIASTTLDPHRLNLQAMNIYLDINDNTETLTNIIEPISNVLIA